jgi:hypothetical protein
LLGVEVRTCLIFEWLLKGRMWRGWVGLPKDAKKLLVEGQMGRVARIYKPS